MRTFALLFLAAALQGCYSYAGPYVTKVESDPKGLAVERCKIKFNVWTGHFQQTDCTTDTVRPGVSG